MKKHLSLNKAILFSLLLVFIVFSAFGHFDELFEILKSEKFSFTFADINFSAYIVIESIITILVLFSLANISTNYLENKIRSFNRINFSNRQLLIKSSQILIYVIAFLITLKILGIDLKVFAIFSGAIGIGIGFGLQKISSNFISGIIILFEKTVNKNDLIEIGNERGFIKKIRARYTLIETLDKKEIMIPNEDLITQQVVNCTFTNKVGRISVSVGVSYNSDVHLVKKLMIDAAVESEKCLEDPAPICCLKEFGDSSINFELYFWVENVSKGVVYIKSDIMFAIWDKFKENNIEIPFPQRDLNFKNPVRVELQK